MLLALLALPAFADPPVLAQQDLARIPSARHHDEILPSGEYIPCTPEQRAGAWASSQFADEWQDITPPQTPRGIGNPILHPERCPAQFGAVLGVPLTLSLTPGVVWLDDAPVAWRGGPADAATVYLDGVRLDRAGFRGPKR